MSEPIRVLCVFSTLDRGGAETMCMNLYRHIDREKVQFDFVKHTPYKGAFEDEISALGGKIFEAPRYRIYNSFLYKKWWKVHFQNHPEHRIVHGHFFTISSIYFKVAKGYKIITVGHIHATASTGFYRHLLEKRINKYTDVPLACSIDAGKWIYGNRKFIVLNNAIESEIFRYNLEMRTRVRDMLKLGDSFTLGTVANLSPVKNPMGLIDIFLNVKEIKKDSKLVWVGDGGCRKEIEERIKREQIQNDVIMLGVRDDVHNILQAYDVFLLPSYNEGLGLAAIESQAAGIPTFCSDTIPKEVGITNLCHFLPLNNYSEWANKICSISQTLHIDTLELIKDAGYDIKDTSKWLERMYLNLYNKSIK